jgi:hypothetical protein
MISDLPGPAGGLLLKSATGALISINDVGITISNGQGAAILLTGPTVTINEGDGPTTEAAYLGGTFMEWFSRTTSIAGIEIPNWVLVLGAIVVIWLIYKFT